MDLEIGQKVQVRRMRDRVSKDIGARLGQTGVIKDFKVLDGKNIGALVKFDDNYTTWFFEDELRQV